MRDDKTSVEFYKVRINLAEGEKSRLGGKKLVPGMPAEAFIQTDQRSALSYLIRPLVDQINRAFREE